MCSATIKRPISLRSLGELQDRFGGKRLRVDPKIVQVSDVVDPSMMADLSSSQVNFMGPLSDPIDSRSHKAWRRQAFHFWN